MELKLDLNNYDSDNSKSSNNTNDTKNSYGKRQRKPRSDKGKQREYHLTKTERKQRSDIGKSRKKRVPPKKEKHKILIVLNNINYSFKNSECVKKYFENTQNYETDDDLKKMVITDKMKHILTSPFLLRRLCILSNGGDKIFKRAETRKKYLSIKNLKVIPLV